MSKEWFPSSAKAVAAKPAEAAPLHPDPEFLRNALGITTQQSHDRLRSEIAQLAEDPSLRNAHVTPYRPQKAKAKRETPEEVTARLDRMDFPPCHPKYPRQRF